jgi:hypothetical protein
VIVTRTFAWLSPAAVFLLLHAALLLVRIRVALWLLPWRHVMARVVPPPVASAIPFSVDRIERAVRIANRVVPGASCLTQALALSHLLSRSGHVSAVQIGVTRELGYFTAHAWVECGGATLLSTAADVTRYSRLMTWPPAPPPLLR